MKKLLPACALMMTLTLPAWAASRTVTLSIPSMNCPVCPITIRKALMKVDGVNRAKVHYDKKQVAVTFDDARTTVKALMRATKEAGYPSTVARNAK